MSKQAKAEYVYTAAFAIAMGIIIAMCAGCVEVKGTRTTDGALTITTHRFFWASEGIAFTLDSATNGALKSTLSVQKSTVDSAAIGAVAKGVTEGLAGAAK